jgi:hypothetical protein
VSYIPSNGTSDLLLHLGRLTGGSPTVAPSSPSICSELRCVLSTDRFCVIENLPGLFLLLCVANGKKVGPSEESSMVPRSVRKISA